MAFRLLYWIFRGLDGLGAANARDGDAFPLPSLVCGRFRPSPKASPTPGGERFCHDRGLSKLGAAIAEERRSVDLFRLNGAGLRMTQIRAFLPKKGDRFLRPTSILDAVGLGRIKPLSEPGELVPWRPSFDGPRIISVRGAPIACPAADRGRLKDGPDPALPPLGSLAGLAKAIDPSLKPRSAGGISGSNLPLFRRN